MPETTTIYRDATFSRETRDGLELALAILNSEDSPYSDGWLERRDQAIKAICDVGERWDGNDATETTVGEPIASRRADL